jgi:hypothetical protein
MDQYIINVATPDGTRYYDGKQNPAYKHFFRVELDDKETARVVKNDLTTLYPHAKITVTVWSNVGRNVEL